MIASPMIASPMIASPMIERLIFGCGRLTGGASIREARRLVDLCLAAGIRHFDTAPSYGLGTAEAVIGDYVRGEVRDLVVTAKVGSAAPSHPLARTWLRRAKRILAPDTPRLSGFRPTTADQLAAHADFTAEAMARSAEASFARLGRIDWLLLHEASAAHATPAITEALAAIAARHGAAPGWSSGAMFDSSADTRFPTPWIAQAALRPEWLASGCDAPVARPLALHSVALTGQWLTEQDPAFAAKVARAASLVDSADAHTRRIAVFFALAAHRLPFARLIVSSSNPERLSALLAALAQLDAPRREAIAAA